MQYFDAKNSACKPITSNSLHQTMLQEISVICANLGDTLKRIEAYQIKKFIASNIENTMNSLLRGIVELEEQINSTKKVNVANEVLNEIVENLYNQKAKLEI